MRGFHGCARGGVARLNRAALRIDAERILHVVRAHLLRAQRREREGIARVVAADHQHQIRCAAQQFIHRILPVLRGAADGVERTEMVREPRLVIDPKPFPGDPAYDAFARAAAEPRDDWNNSEWLDLARAIAP